MEKIQTKNNAVLILRIVVGFLLLYVIGELFLSHLYSDVLVYRFNPYALLPLVAVASHAVLIVMLIRLRRAGTYAGYAVAFLSALLIWGFGWTMKSFSYTPEAVLFWESIAAIGYITLPTAFLIFAMQYSLKREQRKVFDYILIGAIYFIFLYLGLRSNLIANYSINDVTVHWWGMDNADGPLFGVFIFWFALQFLLALMLFIFKYRKSAREKEKKQIRLFLLAVIIPFSIGIVTDGIIPVLYGSIFIPFGVILSTITGIMLIYGFYVYDFFGLTPLMLSSEILATMAEGVIVLNTELEIEFANNQAHKILRRKNSLLGASFTECLPDRKVFILMKEKVFDILSCETTKSLDYIEVGSSKHPKAVSLSASAICTSDGIITGYIIVFNNLEELKKMNEKLSKSILQAQKLNEAMVGRELKMIELKRKIRKLKSNQKK